VNKIIHFCIFVEIRKIRDILVPVLLPMGILLQYELIFKKLHNKFVILEVH